MSEDNFARFQKCAVEVLSVDAAQIVPEANFADDLDADSLDYLSGCEIHFDDGLAGKGFEIRNPNAESTCGCGKSFN